MSHDNFKVNNSGNLNGSRSSSPSIHFPDSGASPYRDTDSPVISRMRRSPSPMRTPTPKSSVEHNNDMYSSTFVFHHKPHKLVISRHSPSSSFPNQTTSKSTPNSLQNPNIFHLQIFDDSISDAETQPKYWFEKMFPCEFDLIQFCYSIPRGNDPNIVETLVFDHKHRPDNTDHQITLTIVNNSNLWITFSNCLSSGYWTMCSQLLNPRSTNSSAGPSTSINLNQTDVESLDAIPITPTQINGTAAVASSTSTPNTNLQSSTSYVKPNSSSESQIQSTITHPSETSTMPLSSTQIQGLLLRLAHLETRLRNEERSRKDLETDLSMLHKNFKVARIQPILHEQNQSIVLKFYNANGIVLTPSIFTENAAQSLTVSQFDHNSDVERRIPHEHIRKRNPINRNDPYHYWVISTWNPTTSRILIYSTDKSITVDPDSIRPSKFLSINCNISVGHNSLTLLQRPKSGGYPCVILNNPIGLGDSLELQYHFTPAEGETSDDVCIVFGFTHNDFISTYSRTSQEFPCWAFMPAFPNSIDNHGQVTSLSDPKQPILPISLPRTNKSKSRIFLRVDRTASPPMFSVCLSSQSHNTNGNLSTNPSLPNSNSNSNSPSGTNSSDIPDSYNILDPSTSIPGHSDGNSDGYRSCPMSACIDSRAVYPFIGFYYRTQEVKIKYAGPFRARGTKPSQSFVSSLRNRSDNRSSIDGLPFADPKDVGVATVHTPAIVSPLSAFGAFNTFTKIQKIWSSNK